MNIKNKFLSLGLIVSVAALVSPAQAQLANLTTDAAAITTTATTNYVAAAGLGIAVLSIGVIVMMAKKGWSLRK